MRSENFLLVAITAERFAYRPSWLVGLRDPVLALDFDLAAAARLLERERAELTAGLEPDTGLPESARCQGLARGREERW